MKESEISKLADRDRPRKRYARVCAICRHPQRAAIISVTTKVRADAGSTKATSSDC
jgi:hypothetical protein